MTVRLIILLAGLCLGLLPSPASPPPECPSALDPIVFETLPEAQQAFLAGLFAHPGEPRAFCWSGPPDPQVAAALAGLYSGAESLFEFNDANHWTRTATNGSGLQRGDPVTITWGILPDGVMDTGVNPPVASSLVPRFDNQFGAGPGGSGPSQRPRFRFFAPSLARWGAP